VWLYKQLTNENKITQWIRFKWVDWSGITIFRHLRIRKVTVIINCININRHMEYWWESLRTLVTAYHRPHYKQRTLFHCQSSPKYFQILIWFATKIFALFNSSFNSASCGIMYRKYTRQLIYKKVSQRITDKQQAHWGLYLRILIPICTLLIT